MKRIAVLLTGIFLATLSFNGYSKNDSGENEGISFYEGTWEETLKLAKQEGKPVFLNISASWCAPCKLLKARTFPDEEVGRFYNNNFISLAVDGEKGEGVQLAKKYNIRGYPTLLFIDSDGKLIAQTSGYRNPKQFLILGEQVINR